ncbi:fat storage-inducing transmembrane protein 1 [Danio rerio]|uniref:Fat storage-inducing transmembrane protein 1 n=1 Tax=Danio rerio TaxID=7955 RepID=A0A286YBK9_DANRE|nr:fat storage-inducing transmembrane protein 1 [Danio rerio]|eukprot:NP_001338596.1 fat storage-inducing transmembrane protein 1 [Danio rerio]
MDLTEMLYKISRFLHWALVWLSDLTAGILAHRLFRQHFHLLLSVLVLFGPLLSFWVSKYSIFCNKNHYLYRLFLQSCFGWTCIFGGSFVFLLSFSISNSILHSLRHLLPFAVSGSLWTLLRLLLTFLVDASGSCFEPLISPNDAHRNPEELLNFKEGPLLLLRGVESKEACLKGGLKWQGCEVSHEILILTFCCLLLSEEISVFWSFIGFGKPLGVPLRIIFMLCVFLMSLWMFLILCLLAHFPLFPSQLVGGALGYLGWKGLYKGWGGCKPGWCCLGITGCQSSGHYTVN